MAAKGQTINVQITASYANGNTANCFGESSASITSAVSGGYAPYTYRWSNDQTTSSIANVPAGYYKLIVRDANGIEGWDEITVAQYSPLELTAIISNYNNGHNISCYNCANGTITLTVIGGATPYTYQWNDGNTNGNRTNLSSNSYEVTITDAAGCELRSERYYLTEPERSDWTMTGNNNTNPTTHFIGTADFKDLVFKTNNTERLRIKANGDIKLNNALAKPGVLTIKQNGELGSSNTDGVLAPCNGTVVSEWLNFTNPLVIYTCLPVKVGIGTYNPQSLTAIAGNLTVGAAFANAYAAPTNGIIVQGQVGIGTHIIDPSIQLTVAAATDALAYIGTTNSNGATAGLIFKSGPNGWYSIKANAAGLGSINIEPTGQNIITYNMNGNVGIGTTPQDGVNPQYKLVVEGKIGSREINVKATGPWPDYVFSPDYTLMPLKEVQEFVIKNHHLPHMPSANEIKMNNGYDLGKMQQLQLLSSEELYLYVIELLERVERLEKAKD